ncbi:MAG: glycosyltransferase family 4 protein [Anaerolineales bacterium]|nr:glycosyltransferase family 4 protein [Anaerolineales bacterium]
MTGAARNRMAWAGAWSREHNNARYEELLPRLANVDRFYVDMHPWWPIRGLRRRIWLPLLTMWLGVRYPLLLCTDWRKIRWIRNRVVVDHDDPLFAPAEVRALNAPNVAAVVVTSDAVKSKFLELGVRPPVHVVPQGVAAFAIDEKRVRAVRAGWNRSSGEIAAGYHQPRFDFSDELPAGAQQMYAVDTLIEVMERSRRKDPRLVLWLVGEPSAKVREYAERNSWIRLIGYQRRPELMDYVAAFDIGLYPRRLDLMGRASIKVLEYMACGVPVVGFRVAEMGAVVEGEAGIAATTDTAFAAGLVALAKDPRRRLRLGRNGMKTAAAFDWDLLAEKYRGLLDQYSSYKEDE